MAHRRRTSTRGAHWFGRLLDRALPTANWYLGLRNVALPLMLLMLLGGGLVPAAHAESGKEHILPQLAQDAAKHPDKPFRVLVSRHNKSRRADDKIRSVGGAKVRDLPGVDSTFVATLPGNKLAALTDDSDIDFITYDAEMVNTDKVESSKLTTLYPKIVKASSLWIGTRPLTGAGIGVAVIDTGIDGTLPEWKDALGGSRLKAQVVYNTASPSTNDGNGHGTHVAGIIAGNSWRNSSLTVQGKYVGIAPEANLISVKVSDDTGKSYLSDVVMGIYWTVQNRQTYNIRVMNLSLISGVAESARTSILAAAVEYAWFNGIFVVTAAGNGGVNSAQFAPANDPFIMTVGAADAMATGSIADDTVAPWSSYGTTQDGFSKPEIVAPGRYMVSTLASGSPTLGRMFPERIVDSTYLRMSGTSMAAPVISGMAALIFQAHPEWTNDQVKWLMTNKATRVGQTTNLTALDPVTRAALNGQGAGEPDLLSILSYTGTPGYANQGLTITPWLTVLSGSTTYTSANWSTANWSTANWSTANWSTANWSTANWSTANWTTSSYPE